MSSSSILSQSSSEGFERAWSPHTAALQRRRRAPSPNSKKKLARDDDDDENARKSRSKSPMRTRRASSKSPSRRASSKSPSRRASSKSPGRPARRATRARAEAARAQMEGSMSPLVQRRRLTSADMKMKPSSPEKTKPRQASYEEIEERIELPLDARQRAQVLRNHRSVDGADRGVAQKYNLRRVDNDRGDDPKATTVVVTTRVQKSPKSSPKPTKYKSKPKPVVAEPESSDEEPDEIPAWILHKLDVLEDDATPLKTRVQLEVDMRNDPVAAPYLAEYLYERERNQALRQQAERRALSEAQLAENIKAEERRRKKEESERKTRRETKKEEREATNRAREAEKKQKLGKIADDLSQFRKVAETTNAIVAQKQAEKLARLEAEERRAARERRERAAKAVWKPHDSGLDCDDVGLRLQQALLDQAEVSH